MTIVFLDAYTANPGDLSWSALTDLGDFIAYDHTSSSDILERAHGAEVIITNKCRITAELLAQLSDVKLIAVAATGYNNIDLDAARKHGVLVANVSGYSTESVVQHTLALLLSYLHNVEQYSAGVKAGRWAASRHFAYTDKPIRSLQDMTMGIFGFGTIGQGVARVALSLGMRVIAHRRSNVASPVTGVEMVSQQDLWALSDVLTLHAPGSPSTHHIISEATLAQCRDDVTIINTARGTLVDEHALAAWLRCHPHAAALIDVMDSEPPKADHPLYQLDNVVITPHQAWIGVRARKRLISGIAQNIKDYQSGTLLSL